MSLFDKFNYRDKRVLVVGGATGMGAAAAELVRDAGAEVVVMDRGEITLDGVRTLFVDLSDKQSIDQAIVECGGKIDALFSCAGVADGTPGIERINFVGHRYMIDQLFAGDMFNQGAAIGMISSAAGMGWEANLPELIGFLAIDDFDKAAEWAVENGKANYMFTKQCVCAYVARMAMPFLKKGVRINAILPGPTDTPLARDNADSWLTFGKDYREEAGVEVSTPAEQAGPLVYLCSEAAAVVSGITLITDVGFTSSAVSDVFPSAKMIVNFLRGVGGGAAGGSAPAQVQRTAATEEDKPKLPEIKPETRMLIDGKLVEAENGAVYNNINPATEESVGVCADATRVDMQRAIAADEDALKRLCGNYIDNVKAYTQREKVKNKFTGQYEEPDERLMRSIEEKIDIPDSRKDDFRREIMNYIGALSIDGKVFDYKTNDRLRKALEQKLFEDQKDSIKLTSLVSSVVDNETQEKIDVVKSRLKKDHGYCDTCAADVLSFVASIFARGDSKEA